MNAFRKFDGSLDRQYLRVCSVYRLLEQRKIDKARACDLLAHRRVTKPIRLVELWLNGPLSERGRANKAAWRKSLEENGNG